MALADTPLAAPKAAPRIDAQGEVVHFDESSGAGSAFKGFRENWENCDPKYWIVQPLYNYKFQRADFEKLRALLTTREVESFERAYAKIGYIARSATVAGIPYALGAALLNKKKRKDRERMASVEPPVENPSVLDRLEWIQGQTLAYLERVVRSENSMSKVGFEGVLTIFDRVSRVSTSIVNSKEASGTTIELVSNIPLSDSEKEVDA